MTGGCGYGGTGAPPSATKILALSMTGGCGYGGTGAPPSTVNRWSFVEILSGMFRDVEATERDTDNIRDAA
jgi:hypothetical protein